MNKATNYDDVFNEPNWDLAICRIEKWCGCGWISNDERFIASIYKWRCARDKARGIRPTLFGYVMDPIVYTEKVMTAPAQIAVLHWETYEEAHIWLALHGYPVEE